MHTSSNRGNLRAIHRLTYQTFFRDDAGVAVTQCHDTSAVALQNGSNCKMSDLASQSNFVALGMHTSEPHHLTPTMPCTMHFILQRSALPLLSRHCNKAPSTLRSTSLASTRGLWCKACSTSEAVISKAVGQVRGSCLVTACLPFPAGKVSVVTCSVSCR